jgi:hypothetical protein
VPHRGALGGFVVKVRTWLALVLISFGTVAATVGCGSDEVTGGGTGGGLITGGSGGAAGTGAGTGGAVGRGGTGGAAPATTSLLGSMCTSDLDCGDGMTCLLPSGTSFVTGGPGGGMCTLACTTDAQCAAIETGAGCIPVDASGTNNFCFESCTTGDPTEVTAKCQGRADFLCEDLSAAQDGSAPFCIPWCQVDAECGTGFFCSPKSGLCEKTKPTGEPVGTPCNPTAATDPCLGTCLTTTAAGVTPVKGICGQVCAGETECMFNGTKPGGFCAFLQANTGFLDPGICEEGCSCDADCPLPGDVCQAWQTDATSQQLKAAIGTAGICFPNANGSTELTCATGTAGGGNTPGGGDSAGAAGSN